MEHLLAERLTEEGVTKVRVWRECLFSSGGAEVRALRLHLAYSSGEILELHLPDHPEMEICMGPPEDARAPGGVNFCLDLDEPENEKWAALRAWGDELLPDPFLENND